jgi:hypothetical protein
MNGMALKFTPARPDAQALRPFQKRGVLQCQFGKMKRFGRASRDFRVPA